FERLLFGRDARSMRDYYLEVSHDSLTVEGEVVGWYRLDRPYSYYLGDSFGIFGDYPHNSQGLVSDLVARADPDVDFSRFAGPDRLVDGLLIVHAGPGAEETRSQRDIWSHKWQLSDNTFGSPGVVATQDGVNVDVYSVQPERFSNGSLTTIGVFCHEYGHILGMPDLYDTDYSSAGLGVFCLMAAGSWARASESDLPGSSPVHPCAWNKYLVNWTRPESLEPGLTDSVAGAPIPAAAGSTLSYRILNNPNGVDWRFGSPGRGEYFLVENRQRVGFDAGLPGSGLLILHVDESRTGNDNEHRPLVGILRADRSPSFVLPLDDRGSDAHLWKASDSGVHVRSVPSTSFYDGVPSGVAVDRISATGTTMTADLRIEPLFLGQVYSFPNPVIVRGHGARATIVYTPTDSVRLAGRYPAFRVQVFNIAGEPVRLLDAAEEVEPEHRAAFWDLKNNQGRPVTSGMYFYAVEITEPGAEEQSFGRLTVVR
ncbi:M6 family metalloprotease domain-containing protein, partial [candidate division WOR-3 bacterium]|nr:M6 family metalloprotease domain-containing protein [candidate division WOR-3 bacterium]